MTYYVHVNRNIIDANRKHDRDDPPVRFQRGKSGRATYAHEIELLGPSRIVYDGKQLLKCGSRLVIATELKPRVVR